MLLRPDWIKVKAPGSPGYAEPHSNRESRQRVADAVAKLGLSHVVVTSVDRDDLWHGGAQHFAEVICAIRARTVDDHRSAHARFVVSAG